MSLIRMTSHKWHFAGVAVGGPRNGQQLVWESTSLRVMIKPPEAPFVPRGQGIPANAKMDTFDYAWIEGHQEVDHPPVNFWVPAGKTLAWALAQLAQAHVDAHAEPRPVSHFAPVNGQLGLALSLVATMGGIEPGETGCAIFSISPDGEVESVVIQAKGA